jgi:NAD(P)-dependent dehydrogenase (short-subunit alcohol dehydrogenase family)
MTRLRGRVALVAGATRGAGRGIARALGEAGATVYCTGRSARGNPSPYARPETIEETAEMVSALGGTGIAVRVDHSVEAEVEALMERVGREQGGLDILVNSLAGEAPGFDWNKPFHKVTLAATEALFRQAVLSHVITARFAVPLLRKRRRGLIVEVTDRDSPGYGGMGFLHDLVKSTVMRLALVMSEELRKDRIAAVSVTPGFLRSETMLEHFGVTEENWRDAAAKDPHFIASETPLFLGRGVAALAADPKVLRWSGEATSSGELARHYGVTDADGSRPDWVRHFATRVVTSPQFKFMIKAFERGIARQQREIQRTKRYIGKRQGERGASRKRSTGSKVRDPR